MNHGVEPTLFEDAVDKRKIPDVAGNLLAPLVNDRVPALIGPIEERVEHGDVVALFEQLRDEDRTDVPRAPSHE